MPRIHPKPEVLSGLIQLLPEAGGRLLRHVESCPACRELLLQESAPAEPANLLSWRPSEREVNRTVDGVLAGFRLRIRDAARERDEARVLMAELLRRRPEHQEMLVRNSRRFRSLCLCGLLLQQSHQTSVDAPVQGERLAALALALVDSLDPSWYGAGVLADTRGRCWMILGNARRMAPDFPGAEEAFREADAHLRRGTGDPMEKAQLLVYKAFLRQDQQRLDEAAILFRRAVSIFLSTGDALHAADSILKLAVVEQDRGEPERASHILAQADALRQGVT